MPLITDKFHNEKLKKYNINIKTKYIVDDKILERNSDNSHNDDINMGIICEKDYYLNNELIHKEKTFDSRIEYSYIIEKAGNEEHRCSNCGVTSKLKDFYDGCPYCGTHYNIDYTEKNLGSKFHYDQVLRNPIYRIITAIIDFVVSLVLAFLFIKFTSRTFNNYDIIKVFIYGIILSLILYYLFYIADAYVILIPIKNYKNRENKKQIDFWNRTKFDKKTFFNNLNYEVQKKYYTDNNIIDYDILDYIGFQEYNKNDNLYVKVIVEIRIVYFENNKIYSKYKKETYILQKNNNKLELTNGTNLIKCPNCGASIDVTKGKCQYCNHEINYLQEWIIVDHEF